MDIGIFPIITAFIALLIVMDPFSSVPVFISLTKKYSPKKRMEAAQVASLVATGMLFGFMIAGPLLLSIMGISMSSFQIGGGILLLLIAISFALGINYGKESDTPIEAVIIGVPLLSGPGAMLATVLLSGTLGAVNVAIAAALSCLACYLFLFFSGVLYSKIGRNGLEIVSRVMGVLLAGFAVEMIRKGFGM